MNYSFLLGRAWQIVRHNRFIWWLGLLAMFTEGGGGGGGFNGRLPTQFPSGSGSDHEKSSSRWSDSSLPLPLPQLAPGGPLGLPRVQGTPDVGEMLEGLRDAWGEMRPYLPLVIAGTVLLLAGGLMLMYFSYCAQAGLIASVQALEERRTALGFSVALDVGRPFFWRLFGLNLLLGVVVLLGLAVLAAPIVAIVLIGHQQTGAIVVAVLLGVLFVLLLIAAAVYLGILVKFATRRIVLTDCGIMDALTWGHELILGRLGTAIVSWLVTVAVGIAFGIATALAFLMVGAGAVRDRGGRLRAGPCLRGGSLRSRGRRGLPRGGHGHSGRVHELPVRLLDPPLPRLRGPHRHGRQTGTVEQAGGVREGGVALRIDKCQYAG